MKKIAALTKDGSLKNELAVMLPEGFSISGKIPDYKNVFVFFDLDTMKPGLIREISGRTFVIAVTKKKITGPVMEAAAFGAYEVIHRPLNKDIVSRTLAELEDLSVEIKNVIPLASLPPMPTCAIVGHSPLIMDVCKKISRLAQVDAPVLITGETGTGKELVAEAIAQLSSRFGKPFVVVNCAAVPETLLESELFGFEKGSFTGAVSAKEGMLKIADEGSVFLDEVGELPFSLQAKLLRFLQTQTFYPLGSTKEVQVNVRVISATNRELSFMVREGKFREDLYHRLRVTAIHIPPLRERKPDILPLLHFFINRYKHTAPRSLKGFTKAFLKKLTAYEWPGNIRELENTIRSAIALSKTNFLTTCELKELRRPNAASDRAAPAENISSVLIPLIKEAVEKKEKNIYEKIHSEVDKTLFDYILSYTKENQSEAARILGINRLTLRKKLKY
jgi:two-component system nitrogen regulation response regulator GlnG